MRLGVQSSALLQLSLLSLSSIPVQILSIRQSQNSSSQYTYFARLTFSLAQISLVGYVS